MVRYKYYLTMWGVFALLYTLAAVGMEFFEGNKITTTLYYGLRNIGFGFILFNLVHSIIVYPISFLPLTFLLNKFTKSFSLRIIIYSFVGGISGIWVFRHLYGFENLISSYELNRSSAIIMFGISGFVYALVDYYNTKKK
ncbi:hypothetical protein [Metabacillus litoralis]|uniref:hypothetical protein n=1 Tax=Metabacillus litoralis TaxID=152268 RepID=UPI001CFD4835|nr:hypothetical protein [Metabacillus litoralis]